MDINNTLDFIILNGDEYEPFSVKTLLHDNSITSNLSAGQTHDLIEKTISLGVNKNCLFRRTNEQYVELTEKGRLAKFKGGVLVLENSIEEKENIEFEKLKIDLDLAKKMLKEFPRTKFLSWAGFIIAILLLLKELYIILK